MWSFRPPYTPIFTFLLLLAGLVFFAPPAHACNPLAPSNDTSGATDFANIDNCLQTVGHAHLAAGTFYVSQSIRLLSPNLSLTGQGRTATLLIPTYSCPPQGAVIDVNGQGDRNVAGAVIRDFKINLQQTGDCAAPVVRFLRVAAAHCGALPVCGQVSNVRIDGTGSSTSGGANMTGFIVDKSTRIVLFDNDVVDLGGGQSNGIRIEDSASAVAEANRLIRLSLGLSVRNDTASFDSSGTRVVNNTLTSIRGRSLKLAAPAAGVLPLRNLVVTGNTVTDFRLTGLYLTSGVQDSLIENNSFIGASNAWYALWIGSIEDVASVPNPGVNPSFNNQIRFNQFVGGSSGGYDVSFNGNPNIAGPDQPTISRGSRGTNTLGSRGIEPMPTSGRCSQYSHAWWEYLNGLNHVPVGGRILLAAAGTFPGSRVIYRLRVPGSSTDVMVITTAGTTQSNCVLNQELSPPISLPPGSYDVVLDLQDGNARHPNATDSAGVQIKGWKLSNRLEIR